METRQPSAAPASQAVAHQQYIDLYRQHRDLVDNGSIAVMNQRREEAAALLEAQGLPDRKVERYKYTSAREAFAPDYGLNLQRIAPAKNPYEAYRCDVLNLSTSIFFIVGDVPCPASEGAKALLPEGVIVDSFRNVSRTRADILERYYHRAAAEERDFRTGHDGVTLLNTLLAQDGLLIYLPEGAQLKAPIQVVSMADARADVLNVRRILIVAERGAKGDVLFCSHAEGTANYLTTEVVEAYVGEDASLSLYDIEETRKGNHRFSTLVAEQSARSRLTYNGVTLLNGQTRNRLDIRLRGEGAQTALYDAVIADGTEQVDNNVLIEHIAPHCESDMLYKYVLDGQSRAAFAGKVYVAPGAQKTASQQTNANLCASPQARAWSQPVLEIYADDVKCNHGSTVGKLDEAALFYMRQRGIPEDEARLMLQHAFINDVLRHVEIDHLRERLSHLVDLRFRGELEHCRSCRGCGKR